MGKLDQAIKDAGGLSVVATRMGISSQRLCNWIDRGAVPLDQCCALERGLGERLRRWDLRPSDWHRMWPELVSAEGAPPVPAAPAAEQQEAA